MQSPPLSCSRYSETAPIVRVDGFRLYTQELWKLATQTRLGVTWDDNLGWHWRVRLSPNIPPTRGPDHTPVGDAGVCAQVVERAHAMARDVGAARAMALARDVGAALGGKGKGKAVRPHAILHTKH